MTPKFIRQALYPYLSYQHTNGLCLIIDWMGLASCTSLGMYFAFASLKINKNNYKKLTLDHNK